MNENDEVKELKKFAALARKKNSNTPYVTSTIYAESIEAARLWFGENNYEVDGNVYASNLKKTVKEPVMATKFIVDLNSNLKNEAKEPVTENETTLNKEESKELANLQANAAPTS